MEFERLFLKQDEIEFIHEQSVKVLSETGCIFEDDRAIEIFRKHGARIEGYTVFFNEELIRKGMSMVTKTFEILKPDGKSYKMGDGSKTMATSGSPPYVMENGKFRFAYKEDYIDICKLAQTSDCIDMTHLLLCDTYDVPREDRSYWMAATLLKYTTLPISLTALATKVEDSGIVAGKVIDMVQKFVGIDNKYVVIGCISPISPLAYVKDSLDSLFVYCEKNQPIQLAVCSLPVLTSPASLMGTFIQNNAELLAMTVLIQLINPGLPVFYGNTSTSTNLRDVSMALGSSETALLSCASAAMAKHYKMPFRTSGALNDAIDIDYQCGVESTINLMTGVLTDTDLMFFSCGMLSGFNVTSLEKYIVDEQLIKMLLRYRKGIAIDKTKDYTKEIKKIGPRGNYMCGRTPKEYKNEHFVPDVFVKVDYNTWQTDDKKTLIEKAHQKVIDRRGEYIEPEKTKEQIKMIDNFLK
ncbi:MAG: trimethylamine methyltransferase family protein [Eubacteriaceae bacterium]